MKVLTGVLLMSLLRPGREESGQAVEEDLYLTEARSECASPEATLWACFKRDALSALEGFLSRDHRLGDAVLLTRVREPPPPPEEGRAVPGLAGYLARTAYRYAASTDVAFELTPELTESGRYQPRFIDEVYSEFETIDNKNAKPDTRNQLKKLFIPLLIILKVFKLKLLLLLPLILGVASFKKLLAFLFILIPGVIGYLKLCKGGNDYGAHGHSSYYNRPPHHHHRREEYDDYLPYQGYYQK